MREKGNAISDSANNAEKGKHAYSSKLQAARNQRENMIQHGVRARKCPSNSD